MNKKNISLKEELGNELLSVIKATKEGVLKGIEIAKQQCPDVVKEILRYEFWSSLCVFVAHIFIIIAGLSLLLLLKPVSNFRWLENAQIVLLIIIGFGSLIAVGSGIAGLFTTDRTGWFKILLAPKLFLIEYITNFMKQGE